MPLSNGEIEAIREFEHIGACESQKRRDEWEAQTGNPNFQAQLPPTVPQPSLEQLMEWESQDGSCEATDGCWVEPDGHCEHGYPSWLRYLGYIQRKQTKERRQKKWQNVLGADRK